jgi:hypothetical protein
MVKSIRRGGSPSQQLFIISSTILAETASRLVLNSLNDPSYIRAHIYKIRAIFHGNDSASVYMNPHAEQAATGTNSSSTLPGSSEGAGPVSNTDSILGSGSSSASAPEGTDEIAKSMMGVDIDLTKICESVLSKIVNYINYIFEPVQHSYTIDVMSSHIQNISILLFILTAIIFIFFISFLFNITLFLFSDRLLKYFKKQVYSMISKL